MDTVKYGKLKERIKAVLIDSLVIMGLGLLAGFIFSGLENAPDSARLIAFLFVFFLYDPIFTSLFGGTLGHLMIGLRVRRGSDEEKRILFPLALVRFIVKAFLGWISLLTVSGSKQNKAIHDSIINSVVIVVE